jgi:hypothetical protein
VSTRRDLAIASISGVAEGWAGGFRNDLTRDAAITEVRDHSADPDVLAETVAFFRCPIAGGRSVWADRAEQLILDAGADPAAVERHVAARLRRRGRGFDLGRFAEQAGGPRG